MLDTIVTFNLIKSINFTFLCCRILLDLFVNHCVRAISKYRRLHVLVVQARNHTLHLLKLSQAADR